MSGRALALKYPKMLEKMTDSDRQQTLSLLDAATARRHIPPPPPKTLVSALKIKPHPASRIELSDEFSDISDDEPLTKTTRKAVRQRERRKRKRAQKTAQKIAEPSTADVDTQRAKFHAHEILVNLAKIHPVMHSPNVLKMKEYKTLVEHAKQLFSSPDGQVYMSANHASLKAKKPRK